MHVEVSQDLKKHVERLLAFTDEERKNYEQSLEDGIDKEYLWEDVKEIGKWIGLQNNNFPSDSNKKR